MKNTLAPLGVLLLLVVPGAWAQNSIRFGVLGLFHPRTLELSWIGPGALVPSGTSYPIVLDGERAHRNLLLRASDGKVLLDGQAAEQITVVGRGGYPAAVQVTVPGRFHRVYQGQLDISARGNELVAVLRMDLELATAAIVASEMPRDTPTQALKAQAVVTRSFLSAGPRHRQFDFCDTTHCQYMRSPVEIDERVKRAVQETHGLILTWRHNPIAALYSSRCGGATRSLRQAGIDPGNNYPYYAVECRWCRTHPLQAQPNIAPRRQWPHPSPLDPAALSDTSDLKPSTIGHGIGLCQHGATGMALAGADFRSILAHYYPNTALSALP